MGALRSSVIRLAHSNPELRPVLLPLLREARSKEAWHVFIPKDALSFGYTGADAESAAATLRAALLTVLDEIKRHARTDWVKLASIIRDNAAVDAQPGLSRVAVAAALRYTYMNLAESVEAHFEKAP